MSGVLQAVFQNQRSFNSPVPSGIGAAYGGGYYAGQIGVSSVATHYLVVAPLSSGETGNQWKTSNTTTTDTSSDIDGPANTAAMISAGAAAHPCGKFCDDAVIGGFTDWYMPAKNELEICFFNLKSSTRNNSTGSGINPNAIPARASTYTNSPQVPSQTAATIFRTGGSETFGQENYWVSTELAGGYQGRLQGWYYGTQTYTFKVATRRVRAVRRVAI